MAKSALDKLKSKIKLKPKTLVGKQKNLDVNKNGKIDAGDFKMLRGNKMAKGGELTPAQIKARSYRVVSPSETRQKKKSDRALIKEEIKKIPKNEMKAIEAFMDNEDLLYPVKMAKGGELSEAKMIQKLTKQFEGKDLWEDEILDDYEVKMFDFEQEEEMEKWKNKNSKNNYIVPFNSEDDSHVLILVPKNKMADGGSIAQENNDMLQSNIKEIKHHADELKDIVTNKTEVEPWVIAKTERASTDLSDVTHYLDGEKDKSLEMPFEKGGYMAEGGEAQNKQELLSELGKTLEKANELMMQIFPKTTEEFDKLAWYTKENLIGCRKGIWEAMSHRFMSGFEKGGYMAEGGEIEDQYKNLSAEEIWSMWNEKQRGHFLRDHKHEFPEIQDTPFILRKKEFKKLPARVQIAVEFHTEDGEYAMGGKLSSSATERMEGLVPVGMMREFQKTGMVLRKYLKHDGFDDKDVTKYLCSKITNEYSQGGEIDSEKYEAVQTINQLKSAVATNSNIETDKKVFIDGRLSNIMRLVDKAYAGLEEHEDVKKLYFYIDSAIENIDEIQKELISSKSELNIESDYINKKLEDLYDLVSNMGFNIEMENED